MLWSRTFSGILLWAASVALLSVAAGCGRHVRDARLEAVNTLASENKAAEAIAMLDSIDRASLDDYNRHFHDFLTIKTRDKAYVTHTSDSLYLSVLDYFSSHKSDPLYPEVVYYGGRVYSDLGDYPRALKYFQETLDLTQGDAGNLHLRTNTLGQTGDLLFKLRLYDKSIPYFAETLELSKQMKDSFNLPFDYESLGSAYMSKRDYKTAEAYLDTAYTVAKIIGKEEINMILTYQAVVKYRQGKVDEALEILRKAADNLRPDQMSYKNANAAFIYYRNGMPDSAYFFAKKLIDSDDSRNISTAYMAILLPGVREYIPKDSVAIYFENYRRALERRYSSLDDDATIMQNSLYNYQLHDREREKAEKANASLKLIIGILIMSLSIAVMIILFIKNRNQTSIIELHEAIEAVSLLSRSAGKPLQDTEFPRESQTLTGDYRDEDTHRGQSGNLHELRAKLRDKLIGLSMTQNDAALLEDSVTGSDTYLKLHDLINRKQPVGDKDAIWGDIERLVLSISPSFKSNLFLLTGGRLTPQDYHTALLIKLNVSPTNMSILLGRGRGTVNSRRATLCRKVFDENKGLKIIDSIIRQI